MVENVCAQHRKDMTIHTNCNPGSYNMLNKLKLIILVDFTLILYLFQHKITTKNGFCRNAHTVAPRNNYE